MHEVRNLDSKRVCDISNDGKTVVIRQKDCYTTIKATEDGRLSVVHTRDAADTE
jgi:hypothetical protein